MSTRVLVTGATGFLGQEALAALAARDDVTAIAACRTPDRLPPGLVGEVRAGDLRESGHRREVVRDVDVVVHAGTWSAMWGHAAEEDNHFYRPARALAEAAVEAGVRRFVLPSTVAVARPSADGAPLDDFAPAATTGFWPHLDRLVTLESDLRSLSGRGTEMVTLRLGHFVGARNRIGLVGVLASRLGTHLVPWLGGGRARLPLIADSDLAAAVVQAAVAEGLAPYESFNICGPEFPTAREVIGFIADEGGLPRPHFGVPYAGGQAFGWLMERLQTLQPERTPFLTRSIVHLARDWPCATAYAADKLGYTPRSSWRAAVGEALADLRERGYPWPPMTQAV